MRIIIDESILRCFIGVFSQYDIVSVPYMGWTGKKHAELLKLMSEAGFDVFITRNQEYKQCAEMAGITILVICVETNSFDELLATAPRIKEAITSAKPGTIYAIQ
jgi:hypothetical protein